MIHQRSVAQTLSCCQSDAIAAATTFELSLSSLRVFDLTESRFRFIVNPDWQIDWSGFVGMVEYDVIIAVCLHWCDRLYC